MIEIPEKIVDYFAISSIPPVFYIRDVLEQKSDVREILRDLLARLESIVTANMEEQPDWFKELTQKCGHIDSESLMAQVINRAIAQKRLLSLGLNKQSQQIKPYDHPDLNGIELDNNNLVKFDLPPHLAAPTLRIRWLYKHTPLAFCGSMSCVA